MTLANGYGLTTTFWEDFSIADCFGEAAIRDTYKRAFNEWKSNHIYLTELVIVLNHKLWQYYRLGNDKYTRLYNDLWEKADAYACTHLKGDELAHFYNITD